MGAKREATRMGDLEGNLTAILMIPRVSDAANTMKMEYVRFSKRWR